jgi:hypothetical protein
VTITALLGITSRSHSICTRTTPCLWNGGADDGRVRHGYMGHGACVYSRTHSDLRAGRGAGFCYHTGAAIGRPHVLFARHAPGPWHPAHQRHDVPLVDRAVPFLPVAFPSKTSATIYSVSDRVPRRGLGDGPSLVEIGI